MHTISSVLDTIYRHSKKGKPNTGQVFTGKKSARTFISPYQHLHHPIIFQIYLKNSVLQRTLFLKAITVIYVMNFKKKFCDFRSLWRNCDIDKASSWSVAWLVNPYSFLVTMTFQLSHLWIRIDLPTVVPVTIVSVIRLYEICSVVSNCKVHCYTA